MKSPEQRKVDIERIFSAIGVKPVHRTKIEGEEIFIADGFIDPSMIDKGYLEKFTVKPGDFPLGCFMTLWWTEENKGMGSIAFFEALHDPGYSSDEKRKMRIKSTIALAKKDFKRRKMH